MKKLVLVLMLLFILISSSVNAQTCERYKTALGLLELEMELTTNKDILYYYKKLYEKHYNIYFDKCILGDKE